MKIIEHSELAATAWPAARKAEVTGLLLAERGVRTVFVSLPDPGRPEDVPRLTAPAAAFT